MVDPNPDPLPPAAFPGGSVPAPAPGAASPAPASLGRQRSETDELAEQFKPKLRLSTERIAQVKAMAQRTAASLGAGLARVPGLVRRVPRRVWPVAGGVLLLIPLLVLVVSLVRAPAARYVTSQTKLRSGPSESRFPEVARLEKGEPLEVLEVLEEEHWLMVKDSSGQVGYALDYNLAKTVPPAQPEEPFSRCLRRPSETSDEPCVVRAAEQRASCDAFCAATPRAPFCPQGCASRETDCVRDCKTPLNPVAPLPSVAVPAEPIPEPAPAPVVAPAKPPPHKKVVGQKPKHRRTHH